MRYVSVGGRYRPGRRVVDDSLTAARWPLLMLTTKVRKIFMKTRPDVHKSCPSAARPERGRGYICKKGRRRESGGLVNCKIFTAVIGGSSRPGGWCWLTADYSATAAATTVSAATVSAATVSTVSTTSTTSVATVSAASAAVSSAALLPQEIIDIPAMTAKERNNSSFSFQVNNKTIFLVLQKHCKGNMIFRYSQTFLQIFS